MPRYDKYELKDKEGNLIEENQLYEHSCGEIYLIKDFKNNSWSGENSKQGVGIGFFSPEDTENLTRIIFPEDKLTEIKGNVEKLQEKASWLGKVLECYKKKC